MSGLFIVTGANRGLGRASAEKLLASGKQVVLACRQPEEIKDEFRHQPHAHVLPLDITADASVKAFAEQIKKLDKPIEGLINNAGVFLETSKRTNNHTSLLEADLKLIQQTIDTNTFGIIRVVQALHPLLQKGARIVNVASGMGQLSEMEGGYPGYRLSKTGVNVLTRILADELGERSIIVSSVCPGWVKTDMGGPDANRDIDQGIETIVWLALQTDIESGLFWRDKEVLDW